MQSWKTKVICAGKYRPRQFEYHPLHEDVVVFGTLRGEAVVADVASNSVCSSISSGLSRNKHDSILGLCWLKQSPSRFVVGSSHGFLRLCDAGAMPSVGARAEAAAEGGEMEDCDFTSRSNAVQEAVPFNGKLGAAARPVLTGHKEGGMDDRFSEAGRILTEYEQFDKLTSVHINSSDDQLLASGYTFGVKLFDLGTGQVVREFDDIHEDHINISRFANHSPFVFATSSFDKTVKAWDSRVRADKVPIYTCHSEMGHVMLSFSPDDVFLLTSAVDNEVKQYLALDGRLHMNLEIPKTGMDDNFTRSYYTSSGRLILSGSSEEQTVRLYCAQTARLIHSAEMYPGRKHGSLYVQSLRGDPHHDFQFSVLVNYRDTAYPLEIVNVDMLQGTDGEDLSSLTAYASSSRLSADLGRACVEKEGADVFIVARDRSRFLAHKAIISCRSEVLAGLLADAAASDEKPDAADAAKLRLGETSDEGNRRAGTFPSQESNGKNTGIVSVCLPRAVAPDIVPVLMAFLYTDRLESAPENGSDGFAKDYVDPGGGGNSKRAAAMKTSRPRGRSGFCGGDSKGVGSSNGSEEIRESGRDRGQGMPTKVAFFEKVLEAAGSLGLERLISLVEWECRQMVNTTTVLSVASVAFRQGTEQLLTYCVHYLGTHLQPVLELHRRGCLPPTVQARVDKERRHRVYALNSASKDSSVPDVMMMTPPSPLPPSSQANGDAAEAGAGGYANEDAAGGTALGVALAAAAAAVNAALRNAPVAPQGLGQGGAAAAVDPNQVAPANGDGGGGVAVGADGAVGHGNDTYQAPAALDPMEEVPVGAVGFIDDADDEEDEDDFIDEEVDVEDDHDSVSDVQSVSDEEDEDEGGWMEPSHGGGNLPAVVRRRLVPTATGHTATAVLGSQMMVLGGGNKRQFHSCRHVLVYDPIERTWSKLATRGNAPAALIYHSCTALEPPWARPRNLLVFGGNSTPRHINATSRPQAQVSVLDSLTLEWRQPKIEGTPIGVRTRHTAVAVHADYEEHERANAQMTDASLVGELQDLTVEDMLETTRSPEKGCGKRRDFPRSLADHAPPRDLGGDTDIIIFGGFSPIAGHAFNDVVVLNVHRARGGLYSASGVQGDSGSNTSSGNAGGDDKTAFSSSSGRVHPARRRRHSKGVHPVWDSDDMDECGADGDSEQREGTATGGSPHGYTYSWIRPIVRGTPPVGRLAHSSAIVRLPEGEGGSSGSGHQAYMVVFGGVGTGQLFNDVSALKCTSTRTLAWERVVVRGRRPARRYGHSMVPLSAPSGACGYAKLVLFGGTSGHNAFNDMFILSVSFGKVDGHYGILAKWESLATQIDGVMPCPRSRQTMCQLNGELIVFGGSDETPETQNSQPASKEVDAFVYHVRPRLRRKLVGPSQPGGLAGGLAGTGVSGRDGGASSRSRSFVSPRGASSIQTAAVRDGLALLRWHERSMAKEVIAHMGLVEAAQQRRAEAAIACVGKTTVGDLVFGAASPARFAETRLPKKAAGWQGGSTPSSWQHQQGAARLIATGSGTTAYWDAVSVTNSLLQPERTRPSHELLNKTSIRPHGVKIVWECIQPDAFVFEPGPEPPVVVGPMTLHKDIQTLIGNGRFADVKFRFQAVDFALPTTPTNTAHYAIVPPPTPIMSPKSGIPSPVSVAVAIGLTSSSRSSHVRSPKPSSASGGGGTLGSQVAASKLPHDANDTGKDDSGGGISAEAWPLLRRGHPKSVVMRSSAGQEWENISPVRSISPAGGWNMIDRPSSYSPLGSGHRSSAGGRRRFFGLSETAEAEAEAAALLAKRSESAGGKGGAAACGEGTPTVAGNSDGGAQKHCIEAHRFLLSLRSDPMRAMLGSGMKETFASVCLLKDIRPPVFSALLTYVYTDTLQLQRPEDITELLVVSNQYNLTDLLSLCEGFLQGVLDEENASHLYHYADSLAMPTFEHRCLTFILRNWHKVVRTEGWMHLPQELRARANAFRTEATHLFMLGQKDHTTWKGSERDMMADWVFDRASGSTPWVEEMIQETIAKGKEEAWQTASDGGGDSDAAFFSADSRSPTTTHSPPPTSPNSRVDTML